MTRDIGIRKWIQASSVFFGQKVGIQILGALSQIIIIPLLTPSDYGMFLLLVVSGQFLSPLLTWGIEASVVKNFSAVRDQGGAAYSVLRQHLGIWLLVGGTSLIVIVVGLFLGLLSFALPLLASHSIGLLPAILVIVVTAVAFAVELFSSQTFLAANRIALSAFAMGGARNLIFLAGVLSLWLIQEESLQALLLVQVIACAISLTYGFLQLSRLYFNIKGAYALKNADQVDMFKSGSTILSLGYRVMLSYFLTQAIVFLELAYVRFVFGAELTGLIGAARRVVNIANMTANSMAVILGPFAARARDETSIKRLECIGAIISCLLSMPLLGAAFVLWILGEGFIVSIFGPAYGGSWIFLVVMLILLSIRFFIGMPVAAMFMTGLERKVTASYILNLGLTVMAYIVGWWSNSPLISVAGQGLALVVQFAYLHYILRSEHGIRLDAAAIRKCKK